MKSKKVCIVNFTNVYKKEHFYEQYPYIWVDCSDIRGTYGYCDSDAIRKLKERIRSLSPYGIHYIDSGNFHYMSKLFTDEIKEPFTLVVFDHHPDMQPPLCKDLLSCGSWLKEAMDGNPNIEKVILLGPDNSLLSGLTYFNSEKLHIYSQQQLLNRENKEILAKEIIKGPIYLSVDKDVLSTSEAITDWNQGPFTLTMITQMMNDLIGTNEILGVDICGELPCRVLDNKEYHAIQINDRTNLELLHILFS